MNNDVNNQPVSLLHFRLRTARHKKRAQHEDRDKQLLALHWEQNELRHQQRNLGWIELNPPVVRGWKRYFVLRPDVAKSKHADFFESILQKINTVQYSHRKDFKIKKRKWRKKVYVTKEQALLQPEEYHFNKLNFTEKEKQWFAEVISFDKNKRRFVKNYVFVEPWRFVLRVRPNIITKTKVRDEAIESRIQQIRNYIERNNLRGRISHLTDGHSYSRWNEERKREKNPSRNKPLTAIIDVYEMCL